MLVMPLIETLPALMPPLIVSSLVADAASSITSPVLKPSALNDLTDVPSLMLSSPCAVFIVTLLVALLITVSLPAPPSIVTESLQFSMVSLPAPPLIETLEPLLKMSSLSAPPFIVTFQPSLLIESLPAPPLIETYQPASLSMISAPLPPSIVTR